MTGFNPRARAGRDRYAALTGRCRHGFNPRARAGRDTQGLMRCAPWPSFNPRARAGRDLQACTSPRTHQGFNPRARAGRDPLYWREWGGPYCFNPRARAGRDFNVPFHIWIHDGFQSTRPRGARPVCCSYRAMPTWFQSTRPRGARRAGGCPEYLLGGVSIHAPARGATRCYTGGQYRGRVSIHAPARGATCQKDRFPTTSSVSIHAPARGATECLKIAKFIQFSFNPRARAGRDFTSVRDAQRLFPFQSTRPRGARLSRNSEYLPMRMFQSTRPRGARRGNAFGAQGRAHVSIHAPARGATHIRSQNCYCF